MVVGCGLGNADSSRGGTQRQRFVALGFEYVASGANECGPQRSVMVLAGLLMSRFVPGMNLCVFRLCRHACNIAAADRKGQPILTLLIFMLECVNGVNIGSKAGAPCRFTQSVAPHHTDTRETDTRAWRCASSARWPSLL